MPLLDHLLDFDKGRKILETMSRKIFELYSNKIKEEISNLIGTEVKELYFDSKKVEGEFVLTIIFTDVIL